jgi:[acyl-carrier-protein] S-malonyltransferase
MPELRFYDPSGALEITQRHAPRLATLSGKRVALLANVTAALVTDPAQAQRLLVEQVTGRVRWRESVLAMRADGVESFVELGGKVVGPMVSRTDREAQVTSLVTMQDIEAFAKEIA